MPDCHRRPQPLSRWTVWLRAFAATAAAFSSVMLTSRSEALEADWRLAVNGAWDVATNWSTDPLAPIAPTDDATIAATGAPYTVLLNQNTSIDAVTLNSADATLEVNNATLTAPGGLQLDAGTLWLRGGTLKNTRVAGPGALQVSYNLSVAPKLENVELAKDLTAQGISLAGLITLNQVTLSTRSTALSNNGSVVGDGLWIVGPSSPSGSTTPSSVLLPSGGNFTIGAGIELATRGNRVDVSGTAGATLINNGRIVSEHAGDRLTISRLVNHGTVRVAGGGRLETTIQGHVGHIELAGGYLGLSGDLFFNEALTVSDGATLSVTDSANPLSSGQAIQVEAGGRVIVNNLQWIPRINSAGGAVLLDGQYALSQFAQLPISGSASLSLGYNGLINLDQGELDLDVIPHQLDLAGGYFRNGVISSTETTPLELGHATLETDFNGIDLDLPAEVGQGRVTFLGASTLSQPVSVDGGRLVLRDQWSNSGGVTVSSGTLQLGSAGADFGSIAMSGGTLALGYATTLDEVRAFSVGSPDVIEVAGSYSYGGGAGNLDLQQQTLDLDAEDNLWRIGGRLRNGVVTGQPDGAPLSLVTNSVLEDVTLDAVRVEGRTTLDGVTADGAVFASGSYMSVFGTSTCRFSDCTIDGTIYLSGNTGDQTIVELAGVTRLNGSLRGGHNNNHIRIVAGATLAGTGSIGNTEGRIQGVTVEIADLQFTVPAGLTLVSATQYDSTDKIVAPSTHLRVDGAVVAGYATTFNANRTDSWTFDVASLETHGAVNVTPDGRIAMLGDLWRHAGGMSLNNGLVDAKRLDVAESGAIEGTGLIRVTDDLHLAGTIEMGSPIGMLSIEGTLETEQSARLKFDLGGTQPNVEYDQLHVSEYLDLGGGSVEASLAAGFTPTAGDTFTLITADLGVLNTFDDVTLPDLGPGLFWTYDYTATSFALRVVSPDFDEDGDVDAADLVKWQVSFGLTGSAAHTQGDADGDHDVDGSDFLIWQRQLGGALSLASSTAVPEPAALPLLLFGALTMICRRRVVAP